MKPGISRKEKAKATKDKIFDTAVELIKQKGYNNVTVSEICGAAGLAKGSFYVHYTSKEDIVRDSYYADMGSFIEQYYEEFITCDPKASSVDRIIYFLNLELEFAEYAGYEITCLSYSLNLNRCIPGPSEHFEKRHFTTILRDEISRVGTNRLGGFSEEEVFDYLESMIRGVMATWCFSNGQFHLKEQGRKYIAQIVESVFGSSSVPKRT